MIGVGENDGGTEFFERFLRQPLDRGRRAHRQERRRFDDTVRRGQVAAPRRRRIRILNFKRKTHPPSVAVWSTTLPTRPLLAPRPPTIQRRSQNLRRVLFS